MAEGTTRPHPVNELLTAVRLEIAAELRNDAKDGVKVSLSKGRRVSSWDGRHEYLFECRTWQAALDGKDVLVRASRSTGEWASAEVARIPEGKVRLTTAAALGVSPANVQIREDETAGLRVLVERLESVGQPDHPVRLESAGWMIGQGTPRIDSERSVARWVANWASLQLNSGQRQAVARALASEVTFLWGPPGTGKTDVVGHIIEGTCRQGLNVLFLAPTKVAVDQALERVCDLLSGESAFKEGLVQRAGDIAVASLRDTYGDQIDPDRIAARLSAKLDAALTEHTEALRAARAHIAAHDRARALRNEFTDAQKAHNSATASREAAISAQLRARSEIAEHNRTVVKIGDPDGIFGGRKRKQLDHAQAAITGARTRLEQIVSNLAAGDRALRRATADLTRIRKTLADAETGLVGVPDRAALVSKADRLQQEIDGLDQQRRAIKDTVHSKCRVLGTTVAKAVQSKKLLDRVDVVVIDEAGMVALPSAWYAAGLARKRVVVAGDFRQLPAVTKGVGDRKATPDERDHAALWTARDVFHAAGLVGASGSVRPDSRLVALDTQYRMRSPICDLVNTVAYPDAPLSTGRGDSSRMPFNPLVDAPLILIDTSKQRITGRDHQTNTVHEAAVHELVRGLQYEGVLPGRKWQDVPAGERATDRLAVIAPYKAQVKALQRSLAHRFGESYEGLVDTIHRFQGSQRPVVILDTTAGAGRHPGYFYQGTGLSSQTCRLLNVALSRAQDHLVVLADVEHLREHLGIGSEALRMLDHLEAHAQLLSLDQLIPVRDAAQLSVLSEEELARPAFFPADEVPQAVRWDLDRATRSIELYSPFLDPRPVRSWGSSLAKRVADGVRVTVTTRDPDEQSTEAAASRVSGLVEELRSYGCVVEFRERMHEKVLILDGTILWHGSLNLLANTGPTDLMMRLTDPVACERVGQVIERARKERSAWNPRLREPGGPQSAPTARLYLDVPFEDNNEVKKRLKARWDPERRAWYVDANKVSREQAARWLPPRQE
ncbi:AAA domain-containing protein [Streptomyces sp. NBC_01314]|uniref:AAA domain-containing protein n=1 Tax=Streptomyces sp. NBC_01314 TaxID=2903821 RepID=UPI00308E9EC0|nr:AAA domain-containing protein [Streptomyces sp. NBC_01314]